jgi:chromosome segregation ATPase
MATVTDTDLKELKDLIIELKISQVRTDERLEAINDNLKQLREIRSDLNDLKINQSRMEEKLSGQINTLDEKVTEFGKRLENQEFTNRGILIALILSLIAGAAKLFGLIPNS